MIAAEQYLGWISATASEISAHGSAYGIHAVQVRGEPQQARSPSLLRSRKDEREELSERHDWCISSKDKSWKSLCKNAGWSV